MSDRRLIRLLISMIRRLIWALMLGGDLRFRHNRYLVNQMAMLSGQSSSIGEWSYRSPTTITMPSGDLTAICTYTLSHCSLIENQNNGNAPDVMSDRRFVRSCTNRRPVIQRGAHHWLLQKLVVRVRRNTTIRHVRHADWRSIHSATRRFGAHRGMADAPSVAKTSWIPQADLKPPDHLM